MKSERKKQRGRKAGDGVLKEIDPQSSGFTKMLQLTSGRSYCDGISAMLRLVRNLGRMKQHWDALGAALSEKQIADVEHIQISDDELNSGSEFKIIGGKKIRVEALQYWRIKRHIESATKEIRETLHAKMDEAFVCLDSDWFQKVADAIEAEKEAAEGLQRYALHNAVLSIAGVPDAQWPEWNAAVSEKLTLPFTFRELCDRLEKRGLRPNEQSDESWAARVRSVCKELGVPFLPSKIGRPPKRS